MMQTAALIAAISFALLVLVGVFALIKMAMFMSESTRLVKDLRERGGALIDRANLAVDGAQAAVDRAETQLNRTESVTASMDELGAGMTELAGQVSALAGFGRAITAGPVGRAAALAYGVRRAVGLRRAAERSKTLPGSVVTREAVNEGAHR
jgi:Tfp pilus assembly protein PilX